MMKIITKKFKEQRHLKMCNLVWLSLFVLEKSGVQMVARQTRLPHSDSILQILPINLFSHKIFTTLQTYINFVLQIISKFNLLKHYHSNTSNTQNEFICSNKLRSIYDSSQNKLNFTLVYFFFAINFHYFIYFILIKFYSDLLKKLV